MKGPAGLGPPGQRAARAKAAQAGTHVRAARQA